MDYVEKIKHELDAFLKMHNTDKVHEENDVKHNLNVLARDIASYRDKVDECDWEETKKVGELVNNGHDIDELYDNIENDLNNNFKFDEKTENDFLVEFDIKKAKDILKDYIINSDRENGDNEPEPQNEDGKEPNDDKESQKPENKEPENGNGNDNKEPQKPENKGTYQEIIAYIIDNGKDIDFGDKSGKEFTKELLDCIGKYNNSHSVADKTIARGETIKYLNQFMSEDKSIEFVDKLKLNEQVITKESLDNENKEKKEMDAAFDKAADDGRGVNPPANENYNHEDNSIVLNEKNMFDPAKAKMTNIYENGASLYNEFENYKTPEGLKGYERKLNEKVLEYAKKTYSHVNSKYIVNNAIKLGTYETIYKVKLAGYKKLWKAEEKVIDFAKGFTKSMQDKAESLRNKKHDYDYKKFDDTKYEIENVNGQLDELNVTLDKELNDIMTKNDQMYPLYIEENGKEKDDLIKFKNEKNIIRGTNEEAKVNTVNKMLKENDELINSLRDSMKKTIEHNQVHEAFDAYYNGKDNNEGLDNLNEAVNNINPNDYLNVGDLDYDELYQIINRMNKDEKGNITFNGIEDDNERNVLGEDTLSFMDYLNGFKYTPEIENLKKKMDDAVNNFERNQGLLKEYELNNLKGNVTDVRNKVNSISKDMKTIKNKDKITHSDIKTRKKDVEFMESLDSTLNKIINGYKDREKSIISNGSKKFDKTNKEIENVQQYNKDIEKYKDKDDKEDNENDNDKDL